MTAQELCNKQKALSEISLNWSAAA